MMPVDIAVSINSRQRLNTNLTCWQQTASSPQHINPSLETHHLYDALFLCAKVVDFCQSTESKNDPDAWGQYLCELRGLCNNSTSEMSSPLSIYKSTLLLHSVTQPPYSYAAHPMQASSNAEWTFNRDEHICLARRAALWTCVG